MSQVHMSRKNIITELERNNLGGLTGITKHPAKGTIVHCSDKDSGNVSIAVMENGYNVIIVNYLLIFAELLTHQSFLETNLQPL